MAGGGEDNSLAGSELAQDPADDELFVESVLAASSVSPYPEAADGPCWRFFANANLSPLVAGSYLILLSMLRELLKANLPPEVWPHHSSKPIGECYTEYHTTSRGLFQYGGSLLKPPSQDEVKPEVLRQLVVDVCYYFPPASSWADEAKIMEAKKEAAPVLYHLCVEVQSTYAELVPIVHRATAVLWDELSQVVQFQTLPGSGGQ